MTPDPTIVVDPERLDLLLDEATGRCRRCGQNWVLFCRCGFEDPE